jgi:hypothetical protein
MYSLPIALNNKTVINFVLQIMLQYVSLPLPPSAHQPVPRLPRVPREGRQRRPPLRQRYFNRGSTSLDHLATLVGASLPYALATGERSIEGARKMESAFFWHKNSRGTRLLKVWPTALKYELHLHRAPSSVRLGAKRKCEGCCDKRCVKTP